MYFLMNYNKHYKANYRANYGCFFKTTVFSVWRKGLNFTHISAAPDPNHGNSRIPCLALIL